MSDGPVYQKVKREMLARIQAGEWKPGEVIPGEQALSESFGCARVTVNRALRELAEQGLVERKRKAGTVIAQRQSRAESFSIPLVRDEIESRKSSYGYRLLDRRIEKPKAAIAQRLDIATGVKALHVRCLHFADGRPFQLEDRWINLDVVPGAAKETFEEEGPNGWLVDRVPYTDAEHVLSAVNSVPDEADLLGLEPGEALFRIERRTWLQAGVVTTVVLSYPGREYRLQSKAAG